MKIEIATLLAGVAILKTIDFTKMKLSVSYKVRNVLKVAQDAVSEFESRRVELASELGTLSEDKSQYLFEDDSKLEDFQHQMDEMVKEELDIKIDKVHIDLIDDYIDVEPANVQFVEWFVSGLE